MWHENVETVQLAFQPPQSKVLPHNHKSMFHKGNKSYRNRQNKKFEGQTSEGSKGCEEK